MKLSFIGMSGIGKSHWSNRLEMYGFHRYCCDEMIAERISPDLGQAEDAKAAMGQWMGFPYESHYLTSEAEYLAYEVEIMHEILDEIDQIAADSDRPVVIDTTGSVIYTGASILTQLAALTQVIYFETPMDVQQQMCQAYMDEPAPVLWHGNFHRLPQETDEAALARSYEKLLTSRSKLYIEFADITLDYHLLRQEGFTLVDFLDLIEQKFNYSYRQ